MAKTSCSGSPDKRRGDPVPRREESAKLRQEAAREAERAWSDTIENHWHDTAQLQRDREQIAIDNLNCTLTVHAAMRLGERITQRIEELRGTTPAIVSRRQRTLF